VPKSNQNDWNREAYIQSQDRFVPVVAVPKKASKAAGEGNLLSIRAEERFGSLVAAGGTIWMVYVATFDYTNLLHLRIMPPGPLEVCAIGVLAWLHAKWRRSIKV
jgi:hypothetical protein